MIVIYTDDDLALEFQGVPIESIHVSHMDADIQSAANGADLVWFERRQEWGTQRKMLKHRNGLFVEEIINDWR